MTTRVPCPTCGKKVPWVKTSTWRPFCSERCRLIDLGDWLDGARRIPVDPLVEGVPAEGEPGDDF